LEGRDELHEEGGEWALIGARVGPIAIRAQVRSGGESESVFGGEILVDAGG
jgi:hypothetical protein